MAQEWAKPFYKGKPWKRCRQSYIDKRRGIDGGMCEKCHEEPGYIVHHIIWLTRLNITNPDIALNESNLMYVCKECHDKIHGYCGRETPRDRQVTFGPDGQPILIDTSK